MIERLGWIAVVSFALAGCHGGTPAASPGISAGDARADIERALPRYVTDRPGWSADIYAAFSALKLAPDHANVCAVIAVIEQESSFRVDPVVPGLGAIAWREIDTRAAHAHVPTVLVHTALGLKSPDGKSYSARIDAARTEKNLSDVYEDLIAEVPLGRTLFEDHNPIRTRGPMQVNVVFAEAFAKVASYPYPIARSIPDELFNRRGGLYFGIAHLLDYRAPYDAYIYRFADFNAGQYTSRNAAFQKAVSIAAGTPLITDGILLPTDPAVSGPGETELALRSMSAQLDLSHDAIHAALGHARTAEFAESRLYRQVFAIADARLDHAVPRELLPRINLVGPKLKRKLTTDWYAHRVEQRFQQCLKPA